MYNIFADGRRDLHLFQEQREVFSIPIDQQHNITFQNRYR